MTDSTPTSQSEVSVYQDSLLQTEAVQQTLEILEEEDAVRTSEGGNIVLDLEALGEYDETYVDVVNDGTESLMAGLCERYREYDEYRDDAMVVLEGSHEYFDKVSLSELSERHGGDVVRIEVQVQDLAKPSVSNLSTYWECQHGHVTIRRYERWRDSLETPVRCDEDDCLCTPHKRIPNRGIQTDVQQFVFSEPDKDDRNSRTVVGEVDNPLIGEMERRETVEVIAKVKIADRQKESKVQPYLHVLGYDHIGHQVELTDEKKKELEDKVEQSENVIDDLVDSLAPEIVDKCGQDDGKKAVLCSMVHGAGHTDRNMIHTLLYGRRGSGKSKIMEFAEDIAEVSQFADAQNASSAGLTATASQTSKLHGEGEQWVITAGTIPQAHQGIAFIDELDKAEERDQEVLATPMASGRTVIKKAGEAELPSQTSIVSASNPEEETYKGEAPIKSLSVPSHIQNRFDVIMRVDDEIKSEKEEREVLREIQKKKNSKVEVPYAKEELREHIAYAKQTKPSTSETAEEAIIDYIMKLRMAYREANLKGVEMTGREQQKLTRLSSAMAKLRLGDVVTVEDVERAWELMRSGWQSITFSEFEFDEEDSLEDLMTAVSMAQTPSQQQVMRQTIGVVDVGRNGSDEVSVELVYEGVDASEDIVDWSLATMEDEGLVNVHGETVEVVDL